MIITATEERWDAWRTTACSAFSPISLPPYRGKTWRELLYRLFPLATFPTIVLPVSILLYRLVAGLSLSAIGTRSHFNPPAYHLRSSNYS